MRVACDCGKPQAAAAATANLKSYMASKGVQSILPSVTHSCPCVNSTISISIVPAALLVVHLFHMPAGTLAGTVAPYQAMPASLNCGNGSSQLCMPRCLLFTHFIILQAPQQQLLQRMLRRLLTCQCYLDPQTCACLAFAIIHLPSFCRYLSSSSSNGRCRAAGSSSRAGGRCQRAPLLHLQRRFIRRHGVLR